MFLLYYNKSEFYTIKFGFIFVGAYAPYFFDKIIYSKKLISIN